MNVGSLNARVAAIGKRIKLGSRGEPDVVLHAIRLSVWARWYVWFVVAVMLARRPELWYPERIGWVFLSVLLAAINGFVHLQLLKNRPMTWRWMLVLSAVDIALITANIAVKDNFDNFIFVTYYPSLALFAVVFSSLWFILPWVTATAVLYSLIIVTTGPELDIDAGEDHVLVARLSMMYLVAVVVSMVVRFERARWRAAVSRERRMRQERVDLSQIIHDTTAQTAFMVDVGIHRARKLAGESGDQLAEVLDATADLSRSAVWQIRGPIDEGRIVEGRELGRVLWSHCRSFETISGIPTEFLQSGEEPPLPREVRSGLFSIAHNALTNAFQHARASRVEVGLSCEDDLITLSISDDGIGLPEDYAERGRGFDGMRAVADRMGGALIVDSSEGDRGTTVTCTIPCIGDEGGN